MIPARDTSLLQKQLSHVPWAWAAGCPAHNTQKGPSQTAIYYQGLALDSSGRRSGYPFHVPKGTSETTSKLNVCWDWAHKPTVDSSSRDKRHVIPSSPGQPRLGFTAHRKDVAEQDSSWKEWVQFILLDVSKPEICLTILKYFPKHKSGSARMFWGSDIKAYSLAIWLVTLAYLEQKYMYVFVCLLCHVCLRMCVSCCPGLS